VAPTPRPVGLRVLAGLNLLALAVLLFSVLWRQTSEFDIWWHLAAGRWILEHRAIPHQDRFSFTRAGHEWLDLHWLYQVVLYLAYARFQELGPIGLKMAWISLAWLLVAGIPGRRRARAMTIFLFALGIVAGNATYFERPSSLSFLFLGLTLALLWQWRNTSSRLLYLAPITQMIWTNCHSLFVLGLFLLGCFWAEAGLDALLRQRRQPEAMRRFKQISLVLLLSVLAGIVNPYGFRGLLFPYQLFLEVSGRFGDISLYTADLRPPLAGFVASAHIRAWLGLLALSAVSFALNWRRFRPALLLAWLGFAYLSWVAVRNLMPFSLVAAPIAALNFGEGWEEYAPRMRARFAPRLRSALAISFGLLLLLGQASFSDYVLTNRYAAANLLAPAGVGVDWTQFPRGAAEFIAEQKIPGPGFNTFDEGGYLIWRLYPAYQVFIDGRNEVSGPEFFHRYAELVKNPRRFPELTSLSSLRYALIGHKSPTNLPLMTWFTTNPNFALVYLDAEAALFVLRTAETPDWIAGHEIRLDDLGPVALPPPADRPPNWRERWFRKTPLPIEHYCLAQLYSWLKLPNRALQEYKAIIAAGPGQSEAWIGIGSLLLAQGRAQEALPYFKLGLELNPDSDVGHSQMARVLEPTDPEAAFRHLQALERLRPRDNRVHNDLAVYYLRHGRPAEALQELKTARRDPYAADNPILDLNQALANLDLNRLQEAKPFLRRYLDAVPDDARAHFLMGNLLWQLGEKAEARSHFEFARTQHFQPPARMTYPDQSRNPP